MQIGTDDDHVHFLIQSVPAMPVSKIAQTIKGITARELFQQHKEIKKQLWGGNLWTSGTVGQYGNKDAIAKYVKNQGKVYNKIYEGQLTLLDL